MISSKFHRASSADNHRSSLINTNLHRNVQRCGVSRRICTEEARSMKSPRRTSSTKCRSYVQNTLPRPLRALPPSTIESSPTKFTRLNVQKPFASRTIVLPSYPLLKLQ